MDASGLQTYDPGPMVSSQEGIGPQSSNHDTYQPYSRSPGQIPGQGAGYEAYKAFPHSPGPWVQAHSYHGSLVPLESKEEGKQERTIWGVRIVTFVLSVLLVLVIIIAAVAGGVGGSMAVSSAREEAQASASAAIRAAQESGGGLGTVTVTVTATATTTRSVSPTLTNSNSFVVVPTTGMLPLDCPGMTNSRHSAEIDEERYLFEAECGVDIRGEGVTMMTTVAYSFDDCMKACASYNYYAGSSACVGVAFSQDLSLIETNYGTCWLKNATGETFEFERARVDTRLVARLVNA